MEMKKFVLLLSVMGTAHAGFDGLTHHSRANCAGFNESISWWAGHSFKGRVVSDHYPHGRSGKNDYHRLEASKAVTWRHAALHSTESYEGDYVVIGYHYLYKNDKEILVQWESVSDCAIYDGWWDV